MLKLKINKEAHEALSDDVKKLYKADGDDFKLEVDGVEDTGALKRAKDREAQEKKEALAKLKEANDKLTELQDKKSRKEGDIETLEKSWKEKNETQKAEFESKLNQKDSFIQKMLVENKAAEIAAKISTSPEIILPHVQARLTADLTGDNPTTKVLDKDGKVSAMTLDELSKEFVDNKNFAPIIVGNKASGSGAGGSKTTSTPSGAGGGESKPLAQLSPQELASHISATKDQE